MNTALRIAVLTALCIPFTLSAAVPSTPPTGGVAGGVFSQYFTNIINTPCNPNTILKGFDTTPGTNYGKRICVALPITATKDALSGFDSTTGAPVYMNAWLKSGTNVYYNTAGGNVGIGTSSPTAKLEVNGNIKVGDSGAGCNTGNEGQMKYNSTTKTMEFCNGTAWKSIGGGGNDGGAYWYTYNTFNYSFCYLGNCQVNPKTSGYSCPTGFTPVGGITGQAYRYSKWDQTLYYFTCVSN